jgi:hypothetical protein
MLSQHLLNFKRVVNVGHRFLAHHSPLILTGLGVSGVVTTAVLAVKATPKALQILEEEKEHLDQIEKEQNAWMCKFEVVKLVGPEYVPAIGMGLATCACIIGAHNIHTRRNAALASLYALSEKTLIAFQEKVVEDYSEGKLQKLKDGVVQKKIEQNPPSTDKVVLTGKGDHLFHDSHSGRYFRSSVDAVKIAFLKLSTLFTSDNFVTLNELYYELGLDPVKMGDMVGWHAEGGNIEPSFTTALTLGDEPCVVLDITVLPEFIPNH